MDLEKIIRAMVEYNNSLADPFGSDDEYRLAEWAFAQSGTLSGADEWKNVTLGDLWIAAALAIRSIGDRQG